MTRKIISALLTAVMLLSLCVLTGCGDDRYGKGSEYDPWDCSATEEDHILVHITDNELWVTGSGRMVDYETLTDRPWDKKCAKIETVNIFGNIDYIGKNAFNGIGKSSGGCDVGIFGSVKAIGDKAFSNMNVDHSCSVTLPEDLESIGSRAFANSSFKNIYFNCLPEIAPDAFAGDFINAYVINGTGWNDENRLPYGGELKYKTMYVFSYVEEYGDGDFTRQGEFYVPEDEPCSFNAETVDSYYHFVRYEIVDGSIDLDPTNPEIEALMTDNVSLKVIFEKNEGVE